MKKAIEEIRGLDSRELRGQLADLRKEQFELRFRGDQVAKTARHKEIRRTVARILTVLGERERNEAGLAAGGNR